MLRLRTRPCIIYSTIHAGLPSETQRKGEMPRRPRPPPLHPPPGRHQASPSQFNCAGAFVRGQAAEGPHTHTGVLLRGPHTQTQTTRKAFFLMAPVETGLVWCIVTHRRDKESPSSPRSSKTAHLQFSKEERFSHDAAVLVSECDPVVSSISILVFKTKPKQREELVVSFCT